MDGTHLDPNNVSSTSSCWIFGYGSLMSLDSIKKTMPSARNLYAGTLHNYRRIFSLVSIYGIRSKISDLESKEMAAVSIEPKSDSFVCGCLFEIDESELMGYFEREHRYKKIKVMVSVTGDERQQFCEDSCVCWTVTSQLDVEYRASVASEEEWQERVGQYYSGSLWDRKDILPMRPYLLSIILATWQFRGHEWLINLLDDCVLADEKTTIREYIIYKYLEENSCYRIDIEHDFPSELLSCIVTSD